MRPAHWLLVLRVATLVALAASAALLVDYVSASPTFCGSGGCATVRQSAFAYLPMPGLSALPLPVLGLMSFSFLLGLSLLPTPRQRARWVTPLACAMALGGAVLLLIQILVIGQLCAFCVVVDLCALCVGGAALGLRGFGWDESSREELTKSFIVDVEHLMAESQRLPGVWRDDSRSYSPPNPLVAATRRGPFALRPWAWAVLGLCAAAAPLLWPRVRPQPPLPSVLLAHYVPGRINVLEFADFQCPHCRELHTRLKEILHEYGDRVHFARFHVPLPMHGQARGAARAAVCGEAQGKTEEVADRLIAAPSLTPEAIRKAALDAGVEPKAFDACLRAPATEARIDRDMAILREAGFEGLPTTYVGAERILGAQPDEVFRDAIEAAARGEGQRGVPGWAYLLACIAVFAGVIFAGRVRGRRSPD